MLFCWFPRKRVRPWHGSSRCLVHMALLRGRGFSSTRGGECSRCWRRQVSRGPEAENFRHAPGLEDPVVRTRNTGRTTELADWISGRAASPLKRDRPARRLAENVNYGAGKLKSGRRGGGIECQGRFLLRIAGLDLASFGGSRAALRRERSGGWLSQRKRENGTGRHDKDFGDGGGLLSSNRQ
jgi:hypothetical protein